MAKSVSKKNNLKTLDDNILAVDLGYSSLKYYYKIDGKEYYGKIPTAFLEVDYIDDDTITYNGKHYLIGDDAILEKSQDLSLDVSTLVEKAPLFIYKMLINENIDFKDNSIHLVTGLSIKDISVSEELEENISEFTINDDNVSFDVYLLPQGRGIAFDFFSNKENKVDEEDISVIIDIGYHTFDYITLVGNKMSKRNSFANGDGINKIISNVATALREKQGINRTTSEINKLVSNGKSVLKHLGAEVDFSDILVNEKREYLTEIKNALTRDKIQNSLDRAAYIILGGGGTYLFENDKELLQKLFNTENISFSNNPYEYSNVRGYYVRRLETLSENWKWERKSI